jgi:hypothetical protein
MDINKACFILFLRGRIFKKKLIQFITPTNYAFIYEKFIFQLQRHQFSTFKTWQICTKVMHIKFPIMLLTKHLRKYNIVSQNKIDMNKIKNNNS